MTFRSYVLRIRKERRNRRVKHIACAVAEAVFAFIVVSLLVEVFK